MQTPKLQPTTPSIARNRALSRPPAASGAATSRRAALDSFDSGPPRSFGTALRTAPHARRTSARAGGPLHDARADARAAVVALRPEAAAPKRIKLVIDSDMALDDWPAILCAAKAKNVDLLGISVTGAGEAHAEPGVKNALGLLELAGLGDQAIPVFAGSPRPMAGDNVFPQQWRDEADSVFGLKLPQTQQAPAKASAADGLIALAHGADAPIEILALGPLTNLAEAIQKDPTIVGKIGRVTIMGGAVRVPGNLVVPGVTDAMTNRAAEWNIYIDPQAAEVVLKSGVPINLVPLDATNKVRVTMDFLKALEEHHDNPVADFVYQEFKKNTGFIQSGEFYFWDPMAAGIATDPDGRICQPEPMRISVETKPGDELGRTFEDPQGTPVSVCTQPNARRFLDLFFERISGVPNLGLEISPPQGAGLPDWYPANFSLLASAEGVRKILGSQGEKPESFAAGSARKLVFTDADLTFLKTSTPALLVDKKTGEHLKYPDTGRLVMLGEGPHRDQDADLKALKAKYPTIAWDDYAVDYREFGSLSELLRTPSIDEDLRLLRKAEHDPLNRSFVITARSDESIPEWMNEYLGERDVRVNGIFTVNAPSLNAALGLSDVHSPARKKALTIAATIALYGPSQLTEVKFIDDTDSNLVAAMELLPKLFPDIRFSFIDVLQLDKDQFKQRLIARSTPSGDLLDRKGQPLSAADVANYRSQDAAMTVDPVFAAGTAPS